MTDTTETQPTPPFRKGRTVVLVPRHLDDLAREQFIRDAVAAELAETGEFVYRVTANTGFGHDDHFMKWPAHYETGPGNVEVR